MDSKGIWDLITKIALPKTDEQENKPNPTEDSKPDQNDSKPLCGSYLKSYNPFASPLIEKPQITSPRADKPLRKAIDLSASKNLAGNASKDKAHNVINLINRHNYYSQKINSKKN